MVKASEKYASTTLIEVDIRYRMALSPVFLSRDLDVNFPGKKLKILISLKVKELAQKCSI